MVPTGPPETLKPEDLEITESRSEVRTDTLPSTSHTP